MVTKITYKNISLIPFAKCGRVVNFIEIDFRQRAVKTLSYNKEQFTYIATGIVKIYKHFFVSIFL